MLLCPGAFANNASLCGTAPEGLPNLRIMKDFAMLDWKECASRTRDGIDGALRRVVGNHWLGRALALALVIYLLVTGLLGWFWSLEPDPFPVRENAQASAERAHLKLVKGYTTVETLRTVAATLLDKPGGYLTNDLSPPGIWLDNMPSWEFGVLVQVRDLARALRRDFARSQSQSTEDSDLAKAEPRFNFDNRSWALPASETEYRAGIKLLDSYLARLADPAKPSAQFFTRADNLSNWLGDVSTRLGSLSQRLSASVGQERLDADRQPGEAGGHAQQGEVIKTPWLQIDNVFYEARGEAWALSHFLRAVEMDFGDVLARKNAVVSLQQIIRELEAAQEPLWSPMVLNGGGYGVLANHSLVMANFISRANAALIDLRALLAQG